MKIFSLFTEFKLNILLQSARDNTQTHIPITNTPNQSLLMRARYDDKMRD